MKKSLIALAVLAASGAAMAQSSVTLYGVVDAGVTYVDGGNNFTGLTSGNNLTSRLGFRGVEDLGGGLKAGFVLEGGFNSDVGDGNSGFAGGVAGAGFQFKRRSTVGLQGSFGEVRLGRELTAAYNATARYDVFGSVGLAQSRLWADGGVVDANANATVASTNQRLSNAVTYYTPDLAGFKVGVNYGFGEVPGASGDSRYVGAGATYDNGPLTVGLGLERLSGGANSVLTGDINVWSLGGSYDLGVAKLIAAYRSSKVDASATTERKREGYTFAVTAPLGAGLVRASYNRYENTTAANVETKADQFGIGYVYNLSKRTSVYGTYAYLKNKNNATTFNLVGATQATLDNGKQQGLQVGVSHSF